MNTEKVILEITKDGYILTGKTSISDVVWILKAATQNGFDQIDAGLAGALGATMVFTNAQGSKRMRDAVTRRDEYRTAEDKWLCGLDAGLSSKTIFEVMTGRRNISDGSFPHDSDDFGRCHRLLLLFPEWRPRLHEVSSKYPRWTRLVEHWDELTAIYLTSNHQGLYAAIKHQTREESEVKE